MEYQSKLVPYRRCLKRGKRLTYDSTVIIFVYLSVSSNKLPANTLTGNLGKASRKKSPELSGIFPKRGGGSQKKVIFPTFLKTA